MKILAIWLFLLGALALACADQVEVQEGRSGLLFVMPGFPSHTDTKDDTHEIITYSAQGDDCSCSFTVIIPPRGDDDYLGPDEMELQDKHIEEITNSKISERTEVNFGPCRGFYYKGTQGGQKYVAELFQVGPSVVLLDACGHDPENSPEAKIFFSSLSLCCDGQKAIGKLRAGDMISKLAASVDEDLQLDDSLTADDDDGLHYTFTKVGDEITYTFGGLEFDDKKRLSYIGFNAIEARQALVIKTLDMTMSKERVFRVGPVFGKEFDLQGNGSSARARIFGIGNERYVQIYENKGELDENAANAYLNSFHVSFERD